MYIITKKNEKDYYDGVAGSIGIDKTIVYNRHLIELEENNIPELFEKKRGFFKNDESIIKNLHSIRINKQFNKLYPDCSFFIVGFCGKLYVGWKLYNELNKFQSCGTHKELNTKITYNFNFMKTIVNLKNWSSNFEETVLKIKNYNALQLFRDLKTPIFLYDSDYEKTWLGEYRKKTKFFVNPYFLKDYEFYSVFDSFQAFQEISMFIGGVLGSGEKEIIEVDDKYKITQHGFDYKWSFRKEPQNKK